MTFELIQSENELKLLRDVWNTLLSKSAIQVPFLRHEYLTSWWDTKGGGEWDAGKLAVITWQGSDKGLQGIAPFFQVNDRILFLGSFEISDYLDLISPPDCLPDFIKNLFIFLNTEFTDWETLDLFNILNSSPSIPIFIDEVNKMGWKLTQNILQPAPSLNLPNSWEEYLDSLDDRYRHEIERKIRKAESYFLPVNWYIVDEKQDLDQELNDFLELMSNHPDKDAFLTEKMRYQLINSARQAYFEGWLQLVFLTVGDLKAAGYLNFDYNEKLWVYNSGINSMFENISPGWVLLSKLIDWSIQNGKTELDFMRGDEPYKYHFGGKDKNVLRIQIQRE